MGGGINVYTYVENNPLYWSDPLGLVKWTGTQTTVAAGMGGGAVRFKFELTSECVNGSQTKVEIVAGGAALSMGIPASFTYSKSVTFTDNRSTPSSSVFSGSSAYVYASWAMGYAGISAQSIRLGNANMTGVGGQFGWDTSITGGVGISTVTSASTSSCGCN